MSETSKQVANINDTTKEQTDAWVAGILQEFDWLTKDKQKVSDALQEVQEKLRPLQDKYFVLCENRKKDTEEALETKHKITVLEAKLKQLYELYKK